MSGPRESENQGSRATVNDMNKMRLTEEVALPRDLITSHREGDLVIFVGAGASVDPPAHLPSFKELTRRLAERACIPFEETVDDNGKKVQREPREYDRFLGAMPRNFDVRRHALELVSPPESRFNQTHEAIMRLATAYRTPRVVTTNYDDHLATAIEAAGIDSPERWDAPFLPQGDDFKGLVHLHGSTRGGPRGVVLTDEDFGNAYLSNGWATRFLVPMFRRYTVLFVGYSLGDLIMRYLARGMSAETRCYALVPENNAASEDWRRLGIQPIGYPVHKREDRSEDHSALTNVLGAWNAFAQMSQGEHRKRIKAIIDDGPENLGIVDHDYLTLRLVTSEGARNFTDAAWQLEQDKKAWSWLCWIDENISEFGSAFTGIPTSDSTNELLRWYAGRFIARPGLHGAALDVARRHEQVFNDLLFAEACRYAHALSKDSARSGARWKALLLNSVRRRRLDHAFSPIPYYPGDEAEDLVVLSEAMRPRLILKQRWSSPTSDNEIPGAPSCDLAWDLDQESLRAHLSKAVEQTPAGDPRLGLALESALVECYELFNTYNGDRGFDAFNGHRPAIEDHDQNNKFDGTADAIIDALRDYGTKSQKEGIDFADRWWHFDGALFRRLAIHLVTISERSADDKINWLVEHTSLYESNYHHETYHLLKATTAEASPSVKEHLLECAFAKSPKADLDSNKFERHRTYNLLTWLTQCDTTWEQARIARDDLQAAHPGFAPRQHPDFSVWMESGIIGGRVPMPPEEFINRLHQDARAVLEDLLCYSDTAFEQPVWQDVCDLVRNTCTSQPHEGVTVLDALNQLAHAQASRVQDMRCAIVEGWGQADLTGLEERVITEARNLTESDEEQAHRTISRFLCGQIEKHQKSPESSFTEQMRRIASRLWQERSEGFSYPGGIGLNGFTLSLNSWPGEIVQYWMHEIDRRRHEHDDPDLTTEEETALISFLHSTGPLRDATLPALSYHFFHLFQVAPEFTTRELLPFFSHNDTAAQAWEAFLYNPQCSIDLLRTGLIPAMIAMWEWIDSLTDDQARNSFINLTLSVLSFADINPEDRKQLFNQTVLTQQGELARRFAESACSFLEHQKEEKDKIWDAWLHEHLTNRLNGIPREARTEELAAWADLVPLLGTHIPDALRLFSNRVFPLTRSHFAPAQLNSIMKIHGEELVAFYAERLRTTSVENHYALVYEIKRFIQDMTNAIGEEKARPLVDATVDAGIPVESR